MPDIADEQSAFREAMARAEAKSGIVRDESGTELNGIEAFVRGETPELPELEGAVPVQASDQPLVAEEPVVETATSEEQQQQVAPAADDKDAEIEKLRAQLAEKDSFIGRQSTEIGDLRTAVDEIRAAQQTPATPQAQPVAITQEMIYENPAQASQLAYAQNDGATLERAFEAWKEEDPFAAASWRADKLLEQQQQKFDARYSELENKLQTATAPIAQQTEQNEWAAAFAIAEDGRPDFKENAARLLEEVAPKFPHLVTALSTGDAAAKAEALTALYAIDKLGNPSEVAAELQRQADEAAAEAEAARVAGSVVTGQTSAGQGAAVPLTEAQQEAAAYAQRAKAKPSLARGFTRG